MEFLDLYRKQMIDDLKILQPGLTDEEILEVLNKNSCKVYNQKEKKGFRQLIIRGFNNSYQVVLITGNDEINPEIINQLSKIENLSSLYQGINTMKNPIDLMGDNVLPRKEFIFQNIDFSKYMDY